jgi:inosose dehydratase
VLQGLFTAPGDGIVDYAGLFAILAAAGYSGWLVQEAEQDPRAAHPFTYAQLGCGHLRKLAREAKLAVA